MSKIALFVGDVSLDLTMVADHLPAPDEKVHVDHASEAPGGVVANAAVACARTGASVKALLQMGDDAAADVAATGLRERGVDVEFDTVPGRTCRVVVIIEPHGEKRLLLDPGVSMYPGHAAIERVDLADIGWVHTAVYGDAARLLVEKCRHAGVSWSLDLEPASFPSGIQTLVEMIDGASVIFCNDRAAAAIGGDPVAMLLALGAKAVIRTLGPIGAQFNAADQIFDVSAPKLASVIDTTGAGDCLAGWFIGETIAGLTAEAALKAAVVAATLSCQALGAQDSYPNQTEVAAVLNQGLPVPKTKNEEA
ncbi:ribokinase [Rhizobium sp. BK313]|uniref:carbohydrate kinase family protein n=1 Tax=Rhizobium sp. BK313 TaxID=2587081 RepID=UPI00105B75A8|nr:carbohydrate kinase family protein [Rhizobium sp. BK313]MBB3455000.1 ribokinase [Rhizobium sp. BK313]